MCSLGRDEGVRMPAYMGLYVEFYVFGLYVLNYPKRNNPKTYNKTHNSHKTYAYVFVYHVV